MLKNDNTAQVEILDESEQSGTALVPTRRPDAGDAGARAEAGPEVPPQSPARQARRPLGRAVLAVALLAGISAGGYLGYQWYTVGRFMVSTDDAYVGAVNTTLASKVSGYVAEITQPDNAYVHAGDVIARIDDGDYRLAVDAARDKIAAQEATIERLQDERAPQEAAVAQAKAQVLSAQAARTRTQLELERQQALAKKDFASGQKLEAARADRDQAEASLQSAKAAVAAAQANIGVLEGKQQEAARTLDSLKTDLAKAERDLSFAVVRAPIDGVLSNRAIQVGDYVQTGARLASIVPLDRVYVDANFKETQIAGLHPGQKVDLKVDALPDRVIEGRIESLAPASGSVFSLLPPDNATGNFTKIVQRLPVRIDIADDVVAQHVLRPGMSVIVDVDTRAARIADADTDRSAVAER